MELPAFDQQTLLVIAALAAIVILLVVAAVIVTRRRKERDELADRFGPEYDRAVRSEGQRGAVNDLHDRVEDRESFSPVDPGEETRDALRRRMAALQYRFVEDPADVLLETQRSVTDALRACGYPVAEDRERALKLLSVDYPEVTRSLRTLLEGTYGDDVERMRSLFLETKRALRDIARVGFGPDDLAGAPGSATATGGAAVAEETSATPSHSSQDRRPPDERTPSAGGAPETRQATGGAYEGPGESRAEPGGPASGPRDQTVPAPPSRDGG